MRRQSAPLIVLGTLATQGAEEIAARLRREGKIVYVTHSPEGCLRVATSIAPDVVLLDPAFPPRIERLLRAHPNTAGAQILHLEGRPASLPRRRRATTASTSTASAGPHAA